MTDVRELLARLNPTTPRMELGTGRSGDILLNIDIAGALGMVPAGLGRDLLELLHGPSPSRREIAQAYAGIARLALEERNRRCKEFVDARTTLGIAACISKFHRQQDEQSRRNLAVLSARVAVARDLLLPERLEDRLPQIAAVAVGYMLGQRLSNRERALALGVSESSYRESWALTVDWLLTKMVEVEQRAANELRRAVSSDMGFLHQPGSGVDKIQ